MIILKFNFSTNQNLWGYLVVLLALKQRWRFGTGWCVWRDVRCSLSELQIYSGELRFLCASVISGLNVILVFWTQNQWRVSRGWGRSGVAILKKIGANILWFNLCFIHIADYFKKCYNAKQKHCVEPHVVPLPLSQIPPPHEYFLPTSLLW